MGKFKDGSKLIVTVDEPNESWLMFGECVECMGSMSLNTSVVVDSQGEVYEIDDKFLKEDTEFTERPKPPGPRKLLDLKEVSTITFYKNGQIVIYGNRAHHVFPLLKKEYLELFRDCTYSKIRRVISDDLKSVTYVSYMDLDDCLDAINVKDVLLIHEDCV